MGLFKQRPHRWNRKLISSVFLSSGGDGVMSSFKPAASAKLYASPEDVKNVGYRSRSLPSHANRPQVKYVLELNLFSGGHIVLK